MDSSPVKLKRRQQSNIATSRDGHLDLTERLHTLLEDYVIRYPPARLTRAFLEDTPTLEIAEQLLHCLLWSKTEDGVVTVGRISEVEAYIAPNDAASHASGNKRTKRNTSVFQQGGTAYVYICYGIHTLLNIVTQPVDVPQCVLLRAILPLVGVDVMQERRRMTKRVFKRLPQHLALLGRGPGCLGQCLGLRPEDDGVDVVDGQRLWLTEPISLQKFLTYLASSGFLDASPSLVLKTLTDVWTMYEADTLRAHHIRRSPRIGIESTGDAQYLEYRFFVENDLSVTRSRFNVSSSSHQAKRFKTTEEEQQQQQPPFFDVKQDGALPGSTASEERL